MNKKKKSKGLPQAPPTFSLSAAVTIGITILLSALRLFELIPFTIPPGGSLQNWRLELATAVLLVMASVWFLTKRKAAIEKLAFPDKSIVVAMWCLVGFAGWSALSAIWGFSRASVLLHTLTWISYIAALLFTLVIVRFRGGLSAIVNAFLVTAFVAALVCLYDIYSLADPLRQIGSIRIKYARFAECFVTIAPVLWAWTFYSRKKGAITIGAGWLMAWLVVMLSASKGAFLAGIIGHIVFLAGSLILTKYPIRKRLLATAGIWLAFTIAVQAAIATFTTIPTATGYISGESDPSRETTLMRLFTWKVGLEMAADAPILGVGANNFGIAFNKARIAYFSERPEDNSPEIAEWYTVERGHNEFLQILAELGITGLGLFILAFGSFGLLVAKRLVKNPRSFSPLLWGSIAGMTAFFASSFVSSFSFRIAQNGVFFFIVFAIAMIEVSKLSSSKEVSTNGVVPVTAFAIVGTFGLLLLMVGRAYSNQLIATAAGISDLDSSLPFYSRALSLDPDNIHAYQRLADLYAHQGLAGDAAKNMRWMIERGGGTTLNYAILAGFYSEAREYVPAEKAFKEAVAIYPNSVFMRSSYAVYLDERNKPAEADEQLSRGALIDQGQSNGWYSLLAEMKDETPRRGLTGPVTREDDLLPENAKRFYLRKREIEWERRTQYLTPTKR